MSTDQTFIASSVDFYLAEDFRQEVAGKLTAVGLFSDRVVIAQLPPSAPNPTSEKPLFLKSLALLFTVVGTGPTAPFSVSMSLGKKKSVLIEGRTTAGKEGEPSTSNFIVAMSPAAIEAFGRRAVSVKVGSDVFRFSFEIRRGDSHLAETPPTAPAKRIQRSRKSIATSNIQ